MPATPYRLNGDNAVTKRDGRFRVTYFTAFLLLLLSLAVTSAVAVLVYFVGGSRTCSPQWVDIPGDRASVLAQCEDLASADSGDICHLCNQTVYTTDVPLTTPTTPKGQDINYRLPNDVIPVSYDIELKPDIYAENPANFRFDGIVEIRVRCQKRTSRITLHMDRLEIHNSSLGLRTADSADDSISIVSYTVDSTTQFLELTLERELEPGRLYDLHVEFSGPITRQMSGLYYSTYKKNNKDSVILTSQAAIVETRKIFPCFDEPLLKATFNVKILRKEPMFSLFNMPRMRPQSRSDGWIADEYEPTLRMSSYLLVFVVCDFNYTEVITDKNITFRTYARQDAFHQMDTAVQTGSEVLTFFEDYFGVPYPLPKLDMIAVPDFPFGAMENWGLIAYRESSLLYEEGVSSTRSKQNIMETVSHEIAHQWFGNLVSPAWWDDTWLNEGFASLMGFVGVDLLRKDWRMFDQFVINQMHPVLKLDGLTTSHPILVNAQSPAEINQAFDNIAYYKGAGIIRMMKSFLGEETFQRGLRRYLNSLKYGAATHDDLWYALGNQSVADGKPLNVKDIMDTWTLQMNYPVVHAQLHGDGVIRFTQSRYLSVGTAVSKDSPYEYLWNIPITYTHSGMVDFDQTSEDVIFLHRDQDYLEHSNPALPPAQSDLSWILVNIRQTGFYRVNYDDNNWMSLIRQLKSDHTVIPPINRAQLIDDSWNLAKSGHISQSIPLKMVEYLRSELDYVPWVAALRELGHVSTMLSRHPLYGKFSKFMAEILKEGYNRHGLSNDTTDQFDIISSELKGVVYCSGIGSGSADEWDFAWEMYRNSTVATESSRLLSALACNSQVWILSRLLEYSLDSEKIRPQDTVNVITAVARGPTGSRLAWDFIRENWDEIYKRYGQSLFSMKNLITGVTRAFNTKFELQDLQNFVANLKTSGTGERAFQQSIERTKSNIAWMENNIIAIEHWLNERDSN